MKRIPSISLLLIFLVVIFGTVVYIETPTPEWDNSAEALLISSGPGAMHVDYNYIPDVRIWGSGDIVWVEYIKGGERNVYAGQLSRQELQAVVASLIDAGIFSRFLHSDETCPYPGYDNEIKVDLRRNDVVYSSRQGDQRLCELAVFLAHGAGAVGSPYHPQRGSLYVFLLDEIPGAASTEAEYYWPEDFSFDLQEIYKGSRERLIIGEELDYAWQIVNSYCPAVVISRE
jgi:hypothetical protein